MNVLAIDSSTRRLALSIIQDGETKSKVDFESKRDHAKVILEFLEQILKESGLELKDIDRIACGVGPGSFTGLRVGQAFVRGLVAPDDEKVIPFSSCELIGYNVPMRDQRVGVLLDARREKAYFSLYQQEGDSLITLKEDALYDLEELKVLIRENLGMVVLGEGVKKFKDLLMQCNVKSHCILEEDNDKPKAENFARLLKSKNLGEAIVSSKLLPSYLRLTEPEEKINQT